MEGKQDRLQRIKEIISSKKISGQEELLNILVDEGYVTTQSTLSRDLKALQVAKISDEDGQYYYVIKENLKGVHSLEGGLQSIHFSGNMVVIKTLPGYANPLAVLIDGYNHNMLLSSVAGDDTILIVLKEDNHDRAIVKAFLELVIYGR